MSENDRRTADWWRTAIIDMRPGEIRLRGYAVEELIGNCTFAETVWLMLRGELPTTEQAALLEATLVAGVDHGPQAPGVAMARMAATCGVGLNGALAAGIGALGDIHGGAGQQAAVMYGEILQNAKNSSLDAAADTVVAEALETGAFLPGFGHRYHTVDPRAPRLLALVDAAVQRGVVKGEYAQTARALESALEKRKAKPPTLNIDGASAVVFSELGFAPPLCRGLFCLSRAVGVLAHAWEQTQQGGRNKGPTPPDNRWTYDGPPPRKPPQDR